MPPCHMARWSKPSRAIANVNMGWFAAAVAAGVDLLTPAHLQTTQPSFGSG